MKNQNDPLIVKYGTMNMTTEENQNDPTYYSDDNPKATATATVTSSRMTKIGLLISGIILTGILFYTDSFTYSHNISSSNIMEEAKAVMIAFKNEEEEEDDVAVSFLNSAYFKKVHTNIHPYEYIASIITGYFYNRNSGSSSNSATPSSCILSNLFNPPQIGYFLSSPPYGTNSNDINDDYMNILTDRKERTPKVSDIKKDRATVGTEDTSNYSGSTHVCQPRHIHLSLGNQYEDIAYDRITKKMKRVKKTLSKSSSMTISFSLPHNNETSRNMDSDSDDEDDDDMKTNTCHPKKVLITIYYEKKDDNDMYKTLGVGYQVKRFYAMDHPDDNDDDATSTSDNDTDTTNYDQNTFDNDDMYQTSVNRRDMETHGEYTTSLPSSIVNQYKVRSPKTNETYISDYIYHVELDGLDHDSTYTYSIQVEQIEYPQPNPQQQWMQKQKQKISNHNSNYYHHQYTLYEYCILYDDSNRNNNRRKLHVPNVGLDQNTIIGKTPKFTFKTSPAPPSTTTKSLPHIKPTKFAIVGDLGQTYNSSITMKNILMETQLKSSSTPASLILIAGDMSYANSIQPQWDSWFELIEPIISQTPLMVAAGNHEIECDMDSHLPFVAYESRFHMPNRVQDATMGKVNESYFESEWSCATPSVFQGTYDYGNAYYSFAYGGIKTIVLSSYSDSSIHSKQYRWLEDELKHNTDRDVTPWIIVMMHTQFYTTFKGHDNETQTNNMRDSMEPLFYKYGVNIVFSGHDHAYMRSKNMYNWTVDENGPIYFIVGEGGNREGHIKNYLHDDPEEWVDVRDKTVFGFGTLEVVNRTSANWKWIMDPNGEGASFTDDVWLSNQYYIHRSE